MSIIIRLQNLPWSAAAFDIREYFTGLVIPEGGVHIVGGEKGDAFIIFGTDEDARQAMERDGGKINDVRVKLLLSSKTEMARVIDQARNQNLSLQTPAVKAAANDSDRRKVRERTPSPRRREKSPVRDRERRRSTKRDRSRTRSRSPSRRNKERDDRRTDRPRRDERHVKDPHERYENRSEFNPRDTQQDRRKYPVPDKDVIPGRQNVMNSTKPYDPKVGSTPQTSYDFRPDAHFNPRQENVPPRDALYAGYPQKMVPDAPAPPYSFQSAMNPANIQGDMKRPNEPMQPPNFPGGFQSFNQRLPAATMGNYEAKRPSPTPATSAPNVGSSAPYTKEQGMSDPYGSNMPHGFGEYPGMTYSNVQTAERGAVPAVPNDRRMFQSNQPVYGAEPHARYDHIPEANQAGRSANASAPREMAGHESGVFGKLQPPNVPTVSKSNAMHVNRPPRKTRFEPEHPATDGNQFHAAGAPNVDRRSRDSFTRQMNTHNTHSANVDAFSQQRERPVMGNEAPWQSVPNRPPWEGEHFPQSSNQGNLPMDIDESSLAQTAPAMRNIGPPSLPDNRNLRPGQSQDSRMHIANEPYNYPADHSVNIASGEKRRDRSESSNRPPPPNHNSPTTVEIRGLHFTTTEAYIVDLFRGIFIPDENIKLQRNQNGKPNGFAYVKFSSARECEEGIVRSRGKINNLGLSIQISPCPPAIFENAPGKVNSSQGKKSDSGSASGNTFGMNRAHSKGAGSNIPSSKNTERSSSRKDADPSSAQSKVLEASASRKSGDPRNPPEGSSAGSIQQRKPSEPMPARKLSDSFPDRKKAEPDSHRKSSEHFSSRNSGSSMVKLGESSKKSAESMPPGKPSDLLPSRKSKDSTVPPSRNIESTPSRKSMELMSPRKSMESMPQRKPNEKMPPPRKMSERNPPLSRQSNLDPCEDDLCVELKGLPYSCRDEEIVHLFDGLSILDIFIELGPDGQATGVGFVEFATPADFHAALDMNGKRIGHRYITISVASKEIMAVARGERRKPPLLPQGPPKMAPPITPPPRRHNPETTSFCIAINQLPKHVTSRDIADFFSDVSVVPRAIHIMLGPNKTPTGEAFSEFATHRDFENALQRDGHVLGGSVISVVPITYQEMSDILGGPPNLPPPPPPNAPLLRSPHENDHPPQRRALLSSVEDDIPVKLPRQHSEMNAGHNRGAYPNEEMAHYDHPEPRAGGRPPFARMRGMQPRSETNRPPRPPFRNGGPPPRGGPSFHPRHPGPQRFPSSPRNGHGPNDFGMPGCVVAINNLHFRAGLEDLLDFFHIYDLDKNSIIRKYNENGQPTSEARVAFNCQEDAHHAISELQMKPIMGRQISLALV